MHDNLDDRVGRFEAALLSLDTGAARNLLMGDEGQPLPLERVEGIIVSALEHIGQGWEDGTVALSQVYMSGRQCERLMDELRPDAASVHSSGKRIAIVVLEDYHFLGMRLVSSVLRASGFTIIDYGRMDVDSLADRAGSDRIDILLVSVLMLRSALRVRELRHKLDEGGRRIALAVGGAPFRLDKALWREVGADGSSDSAAGAVALVRRLAGEVA
ncbi:MAG: cobalamin-binding protein [Spirochaetae bacterium HGW-Spirochaetae-7]|jgi:methanogenic corrinoid protein MtbC1|nr:MAG: cobalamin-binding protein [Spirochaetae bacterium HGW-Spirochaetae-7]